MLLYFIRTDRLSEVLPLKAHFLDDPKLGGLDAGFSPSSADTSSTRACSPTSGTSSLPRRRRIPAAPEEHYNLARYFRQHGRSGEERKALDNAVTRLRGPAGPEREAGRHVHRKPHLARRFPRQDREWIGAERDYAAAVSEYEKALELRRVKKSPRFGEAYAGLADVAYYQRDDLASALALYDKAADNGYVTADTTYKTGNILYRTGRYKESLDRFFQSAAKAVESLPGLRFRLGLICAKRPLLRRGLLSQGLGRHGEGGSGSGSTAVDAPKDRGKDSAAAHDLRIVPHPARVN